MIKLIVIFTSAFCNVLVNGGADYEVERVSHPNVESRDVGPFMESRNTDQRHSFGNYNCPTCGTSNSGYNSGRNFGSTSFSSGSPYGQPVRSSHYQKSEKEEFVDGQKVYDFHHEKEFQDGHLIKDIKRERTPEEFDISNSNVGGSSIVDNSRSLPYNSFEPKYYPNTGRSSTTQHVSSSSVSRPQIAYRRQPHSTNIGSQTVTGTFQGSFNNAEMEAELERMRQDMERRTLALHHGSNSLSPARGGGNHRTEVRTQMKYVNGKPVYIKNEERKYRDGQLIHNATKEHGPQDLHSGNYVPPSEKHYSSSFKEASNIRRQPYQQSYPSQQYSSHYSTENVRNNYRPEPQYKEYSNQYYSRPYTSSSYARETSDNEPSDSVEQNYAPSSRYQQNSKEYLASSNRYSQNHFVPKFQQNVLLNSGKTYKTEVRGKTVSSGYHSQPDVSEENTEEETLRRSHFNTNQRVDDIGRTQTYNSKRVYHAPREVQYMPGIKSQYSSSSSYEKHYPEQRIRSFATTTTETPKIVYSPYPESSSSYHTSRGQQYVPTYASRKRMDEDNENPYLNHRNVTKSSSHQQTFRSSSNPTYYGSQSPGYKPYAPPSQNIPGVYSYQRSSKKWKSSHGSNEAENDIDENSKSVKEGYDSRSVIDRNQQHVIFPGVISGPLEERREELLSPDEEERYDISPLVDGEEEEDDIQTTSEERILPQIPNSGYQTVNKSSERTNYYHNNRIPSSWIETSTHNSYVNGMFANQIIFVKYFENGILVDQNVTEKTRDQLAQEGTNVYTLDLTHTDLERYGPYGPSESSVHTQRHENFRIQKFKSGLPIYEVNEELRFQDGKLVHQTREEKNEDDFLKANRLHIESQRLKIPTLDSSYISSGISTNPVGYVKKHEVHQEEEFVNGQKVYDLHHERKFHNGNLIHENKTELGPGELGAIGSVGQNNMQGGAISDSSYSGRSYSNYLGSADSSDRSLTTGCITCKTSNNYFQKSDSKSILGSFVIPQSQNTAKMYRKDVNIEEHYKDGKLVKGIEDNKEWNDGVLTDANTEHYYDQPSRTNIRVSGHPPLTNRVSSNNNRVTKISRNQYEDCSFNPCKNGGSCKMSGQNPVCICPFGFRGSRCDEAYCPNRFCRNRGICSISQDNEHDCKCAEGFTGDRCTTRFYKIRGGIND